MLNEDELRRRDFSVAMDGKQFLTQRTSTATVGGIQTFYLGLAHPGSAEADPVWMIQRVTIAVDDSTATLFASGQASFNQVWANRASLTYS